MVPGADCRIDHALLVLNSLIQLVKLKRKTMA